MTTTKSKQLFYAAPFAFTGEFFGLCCWSLDELSPRWLGYFRGLLSSNGSQFTTALPDPLHRIELRFTSAQGAALVNVSLDRVPVASSVLLRGDNSTVEQELLTMFVDSARRVEIVRGNQITMEPFTEVFGIQERPLHTVITFGGGEDADIIPELGTHLAAAFFYDDRL